MSGKLVHPAKYLTLIERAKRSQWNRTSVPADLPEKLLPNTRWICALCQKYSCSGDAGDLFGPYYIELDLSSDYFPDFLFPKDTQRPTDIDENPPSIDVYLHGRCALWSEDLFFLGGRFPMLKEKLYEFWEKACRFCGVSGASIKCPDDGDSFVHFHCLRNQS
ncbi:hypothetical protein FO519_006290 [Halicephalobus sp. NKZ332]|nr:hypothetical protein FO519_006290 [Halicephalobus sp. NKZ332]